MFELAYYIYPWLAALQFIWRASNNQRTNTKKEFIFSTGQDNRYIEWVPYLQRKVHTLVSRTHCTITSLTSLGILIDGCKFPLHTTKDNTRCRALLEWVRQVQLHPSILGIGCMHPSIFSAATSFTVFCLRFLANIQILHP